MPNKSSEGPLRYKKSLKISFHIASEQKIRDSQQPCYKLSFERNNYFYRLEDENKIEHLKVKISPVTKTRAVDDVCKFSWSNLLDHEFDAKFKKFNVTIAQLIY
jgi:hypothetical protein